MRDLAATRDVILAAAEACFAERGYDGASMQEIATAAGVSRGMPTYAFGSKRQLYEAVLGRALSKPRALAREVATEVQAGDPVDALRRGIESYIDFLAHNPTYVRLLSRAALDAGSAPGGAPASLEGLADALGAVTELLAIVGTRGTDPRQLVVSTIALCFFPFAHNRTLLRPLGLDVTDPSFLAQHKAHVVQVVLKTLSASLVQPVGPTGRDNDPA